ncbi:16S rRNA (cytosine(1402)-N(4))-methyltransferase [Candidatus Wolfebacteria bacterium RIFCSPHIGHO2_01_FULL_48_22]|uniref:Ribosomal RNA small subunit methyltransferase H n=2 Tax=Candidatus Wolfeibacteriota TaxID=1752735 RepID=A0A1F8DRN4_9BACT|nr:MAG: 16S rRNA (cytosine(1402)-N(4))-methyltransferase [Candidatus Wolfebacteria bacterium RIFCSPHIGHO2_01_FULL_48_22]OGM92204.1 MAG: 16S rRNA (cytosine(1402)-N(4))-methyltransferase [Candidatus Wolfebacteria bacterium RIFCSPLOWO2_01_FULL_47_17b]
MHQPVLLHEIIQLLDVQKEDTVVDGTLNGGGHAKEILQGLGPGGTFIGIETDKRILETTKKEMPNPSDARTHFVHANYRDARAIMHKLGVTYADAILLDLGFSSHQIQDPSRGFSFQHDGPLDMRYNQSQGDPAYVTINELSEKELADIMFAYGEERQSRKIAKAIVEHRKKERIIRTGQLKKIIGDVLGTKPWGKIHPATRAFQALRIYVNDELGNLAHFLETVPSLLAPGGRCAIISFHSLEDRMVKQSFRNFKKEGVIELLTKKPITPTVEESTANPRSRSAKLRGVKKNDSH